MLKLNRKLPEVYLESYELPNGLTADVYDYSRKLAGDRWLVGLIIRIDVEVRESDFDRFENGKELFEKFKEENGSSVTFEMTKERNFIDQQEKDKIFAELLKSIKENTMKYMGHEKLADRFRRKKLAEFIERQNWWK
jgi:hypothetical protein